MPYLTHAEYEVLGQATVDETEFPKLLQKASDVVDSVTRSFYAFNELSEDRSEFRRTQFKKAVAAQLDYFVDMGATTAHGLNSLLSATVGRTSFATGENNQKKLNNVVSEDVYMLLRHTGLLYRGVQTL